MNLRLDWCTHEAAQYAVTHWHYSKVLPAGKLVKIGVWEDEAFKGAVIYSYGANRNLAKSFGLPQTEVCELTRIALREHETPVSRIIGISLKMLKRQSPGLKVVVSYADTEQDHLGVVYQASNWLYVGPIQEGIKVAFVVRGKRMHPRSVGAKGWVQSLKWLKAHIDPNATQESTTGKHKYLWIFDSELQRKYAPDRKPYPKHAHQVKPADTSDLQSEKGGAAPTDALESSSRRGVE